MSYRWIEHTGEQELEIVAATEAGVFADALEALADLFADEGGDAAALCREVRVAGAERAALLVDWLDELVYLAETERFVPEAADRIALTGDGVAALVRGHRGDPRPLVKGATYHRLSFTAAENGFRATVVLDV